MNNLNGKNLNEFEQLLCKQCSAVLGIKVMGKEKLLVNGQTLRYSTTQLLTFRRAIDLNADVPEEIEVCGVFDGQILKMAWSCSVCGCVMKWHPSKQLAQYLATTYLAE